MRQRRVATADQFSGTSERTRDQARTLKVPIDTRSVSAIRPASAGRFTAAATSQAKRFTSRSLSGALRGACQRYGDSEIRALFAVAARPEIVSLAGGMPFISALPLDAVGEMAGQLVADRGAVALQYGSGQGDLGLREGICEVMSLEGIRAHPDEVVVTVGSQQALDLLTRIFIDPGDVVLAEGPSYVGALGTFASYEATVVHVPMDDRGLIPESLSETIIRLAAAGRRVKFLYTCPSFHNPAGVSLDGPRRAAGCRRSASARVCRLSRTIRMGYSDSIATPSVRCERTIRMRVIFLGSFSKTIAPGLRVGWVLSPPGVRDKRLGLGRGVGCTVPFQLLPAAGPGVSRDPAMAGTGQSLPRAVPGAPGRHAGSLSATMPPGSHWTTPGGGFYVWLGLPGGVNSKAMLPRAIASRVAYVPGTGFYADGSGIGHLRLSYCFP